MRIPLGRVGLGRDPPARCAMRYCADFFAEMILGGFNAMYVTMAQRASTVTRVPGFSAARSTFIAAGIVIHTAGWTVGGFTSRISALKDCTVPVISTGAFPFAASVLFSCRAAAEIAESASTITIRSKRVRVMSGTA